MDATKTGARHNATDMGHLSAIRGHARAIMDRAEALGAVADELPMAKAVQIAPDAHPGAMVALMLSAEQQQALRDASGIGDAEADHVTLAYLGGDASALIGQKNGIIQALAGVAAETPALAGECGGVARFSASESSDGQDVIVALYDSPDLPDLYADVIEALECCGIAPASDHGFTPHITLAYVPTDSASPVDSLPRVSLPIASLSLVWAGERIDFPLQGVAEEDTRGVDTSAAETILRDALGMGDTGPDAGLSYGTTVYAGDAVKSLPAGHVGGYLVRFSTPNDPDLAGEYFTKDTDFGIQSGAKTHVWFHHRGAFKTRDGRVLRITDPIGEGVLKMDDTGVFVDAVLYNRERYQAVLDDLGWSSGTASHIVDAEPTGKATWIKRWYLGLDASLTFGPCEPRNQAIPLKSLPLAEVPFLDASSSFDTKSVDEPETSPQTVPDQPVATRSVLPMLVSGYIAMSESTIKRRLERLRRTNDNG